MTIPNLQRVSLQYEFVGRMPIIHIGSPKPSFHFQEAIDFAAHLVHESRTAALIDDCCLRAERGLIHNQFYIGVQGEELVIGLITRRLTIDEALNIAAWIVVLVDPSRKRFREALRELETSLLDG
jgi:hypothetical protein